MLIRPGVEIKPVKGDPVLADRNLDQRRADFRIEAFGVHAEIARRIPHAEQTRLNLRRHIDDPFP